MRISIDKDGLVNNTELYNDSRTPQQYARVAVHAVLEQLSIPVEEEWEMDDDSIELTINETTSVI